MRLTIHRASLMALSLSLALVAPMRAAVEDGQAYWPQWRGPFATGASDRADPPVEWSETKNVKWKVEIPGRGSASPVVWGDRLFLLTAVPKDMDAAAAHQPLGSVRPRAVHRYVVLAIDRRSGKTVWERTAREAPPTESTHQENGTWASSSAVTDGEHVGIEVPVLSRTLTEAVSCQPPADS